MSKGLKVTLLLIIDILCCAFSSALANLLFFDFSFSAAMVRLSGTYYMFILICATILGLGAVMGIYANVWTKSGLIDLLMLTLVHVLAGALWLILKFTGAVELSGSIMVIFFVVNYLITVFTRLAPKILGIIHSKAKLNRDSRGAVIVGCGDTGTSLVYRLVSESDRRIIPVAFIDNDPKLKGSNAGGVRVYGDDTVLRETVFETGAQMVIIALPSCTPSQIRRIYDCVKDTGVEIKVYRGIENYDAGIGRTDLQNINIEDLLGRDVISLDNTPTADMLRNSTVMITGGAGSIGSEICRQVLGAGVRRLIIYDCCENGLYDINEDLKKKYAPGDYVTVLGSVRDRVRLASVFEAYKPDYVFHAAAHKHVPMMELNPVEAVKNNVFGTRNVLSQCVDSKVRRCILISTDKAVNSSSIMGATKHVAELLAMEYNKLGVTEFAAVRFGNVLGSVGSVVPLFKKQIAAGGPVTVTDMEMKRYFMTIPEAVSLVLQAGALAQGGEIFVLDMGQPVRIYDLAKDMIRLSGLTLGVDIDITIIGQRPGEKLFEELALDSENVDSTSHSKIFVCKQQKYDPERFRAALGELESAVAAEDPRRAESIMFGLLPSNYRI